MTGLALVSLVVRDYDEAIAFYVGKLGFTLIEDSPAESSLNPGAAKRWVVVAPPGGERGAGAGGGARILLARADGPAQEARIGDQTGGRVFLFLETDDFERDYTAFRAAGVRFVRGAPRDEAYGRVAVFEDLYGNLWDLIEPR